MRRFLTRNGDRMCKKKISLLYNWCQNSKGINIKRRPIYFPQKCIHCGNCTTESEFGGVTMSKGNNINLDISKPEDWDNIMQICPTGAIIWNL